MSKTPIGPRIEQIFHTEASEKVPADLDLWPRIAQAGHSHEAHSAQHLPGAVNRADQFVSDLSHVGQSRVSIAPTAKGRTTPRNARPLQINTGMVLVALLALAAATLALVTGGRFQPAASQPASGVFLQPGKVRHLVLTGTYTTDKDAQTTEQHREEFWLTPGERRTLMRSQVTVPISAMTWLEEDAYYEYHPDKSNQVQKRAYNPHYLAALVPDPDIITKTLRLPGARLVGDDTLDGRPVVVITVISTNAPDPTPSAGAEALYTTTTGTYWIDRETNQLRQYTGVITPPSTSTSRTERIVNRIALDELIDRSALPPDFFQFTLPPGATLVGEDSAPFTPTPVR